MEKAALRQKYLKQRQAMSELMPDRSKLLCSKLIPWLEEQQPQQIFTFLATRGEPDLLPVAAAFVGKVVLAVPVVLPGTAQMSFYSWGLADKLKKNVLGISEPASLDRTTRVFATSRTMILVPALALDREGFRLGYGKGFYDRYLAAYASAESGVTIVGVVCEEFFSGPLLPREKVDVPVQFWASEAGVVRLPIV